MDCNIITPIQIVHVQRAFCEERQRPIVIYDSRAYSSNNPLDYLRINTTVDGDEVDLQPGSWAFVHANANSDTQDANFDLDLDVMAIKELSTDASHLPVLFDATGIVDLWLNGLDGKWVVLEVNKEMAIA